MFLVLLPTFSHSLYGLSPFSALTGIKQSLCSWPIWPQLKHYPMGLSYLNATLDISPFGLLTGPPRLSGLFSGTSIQMRKNWDWSELKALQSTSTRSPMVWPLLLPAFSLIRSKGSPYTWIQKVCFVKVTFLTDIPFSHHLSANRWLLKHHGPLFQTHINWLSIKNLNCSRPFPTSTIFKSSPSFHMDRSKFLATCMFIGYIVRNFPMRLNESSSSTFSFFTGRIGITSSSSVVSIIFCICSRTSDSMTVFVSLAVSVLV